MANKTIGNLVTTNPAAAISDTDSFELEQSSISKGGLFSQLWTWASNHIFGVASSDTAITGVFPIMIGTTPYTVTRLVLLNAEPSSGGITNVRLGNAALYSNTTGISNVAIGNSALYFNTTGINNTAIGRSALYSNDVGGSNTAIGRLALYSNTTGGGNTAIGRSALNDNTTGGSNTAIGYAALTNNTTGINNTAIGNGADNTATNLSNIITLGNSSITTLRCQVTTITALSDERDKINIKDISLGLDFINQIRPVEFDWDMREWYAKKDENGIALKDNDNNYILNEVKNGSKKGKHDYNFIAQELLRVQKKYPWINLVNTDNKNRLETSPGKLLPIIVKAIQELSEEINLLKENK